MSVEEFKALAAKPKKVKRKSVNEWLAQFRATPPAPELTPMDRAIQRDLFERHDTAVYAFRVGLAPTANKHWVPFILGRGRKAHASLHLSEEAKAFRQHVAEAWSLYYAERFTYRPAPLTGKLRLLLVVHPRNAGETDSDNRIKPTQDGLAFAGVYANDSQIKSLRVDEGPIVRPHGAIDIIIETLE